MGQCCAQQPAVAKGAQAKVLMMPPSQNAVGPVLLAMDLGVGEPEFCDLMSGAHKKPEYLAIHPYGQIPALKDGEFCLGESNAILRYLAIAYGNKYYPCKTDPAKCGQIDFAIDAFSNVYKAHVQVVYPIMGFGAPPSDQSAANQEYSDAITKWLEVHVGGNAFVGGAFPTIADFKAVPFFYSAMQPTVLEKAAFKAPERMKKYVTDFMGAIGATKFMQEAGGYAIKEFLASKGTAAATPDAVSPGSKPLAPPPAGSLWTQSKPAQKAKVFMMPPSQNACGPVLLAMDLDVGGGEFCDLMSGAHKKPEHLAIHPYGQIPALQDGNVKLGESNAILRYLALAYGQKYYPAATAPETCGKIDFALDAFSNVYKAHMKVVYPVMGFGSPPEDQAAANKEYTEAITKWFDIHVKGKFVNGDELSIADFKAAPFFFSAIQPALKSKAGFEAPARAVQYCDDFMKATKAHSFMLEAGGYSIKEFLASKDK